MRAVNVIGIIISIAITGALTCAGLLFTTGSYFTENTSLLRVIIFLGAIASTTGSVGIFVSDNGTPAGIISLPLILMGMIIMSMAWALATSWSEVSLVALSATCGSFFWLGFISKLKAELRQAQTERDSQPNQTSPSIPYHL